MEEWKELRTTSWILVLATGRKTNERISRRWRGRGSIGFSNSQENVSKLMMYVQLKGQGKSREKLRQNIGRKEQNISTKGRPWLG